LFSITCNDSLLNLSSFFNVKAKNTTFTNCTLEQTDFTNADLSASVFDRCNLYQTIFENSILENVDFRTSKNITLNPEINRIKFSKFSKTNALGLLAHYTLDIE